MSNSSGHAGITMQDQDNTNAKTFFKEGGATEIQTQNNTAHGVFKVTGWNGSASAEFMRMRCYRASRYWYNLTFRLINNYWRW